MPTGKNKKVVGLMEDVLERKVMTKFVVLRPKTYSHLIDDGDSDKKAKGTEKCIKKRELKFKNYEDCNKATQLDNTIKYCFEKEL